MKNLAARIRIVFLLLAALSGLFFSGCFEQQSLRDIAIAAGVGIDADPQNTASPGGGVVITVEVIDVGAGEGGKALIASKLLSAQGETVTAAVANLNQKLNKKLFWGQLQLIVIGQEAMERGLASYLDFFLKSPEISPLTDLICARGKAAGLLQGICGLSPLPSLALAQIMDRGDGGSGKAADPLTLQEVAEKTLSSAEAVIIPLAGTEDNVPETGEKKIIKFEGMAVLGADGKLKGLLEGKEALGALLWFDTADSFAVSVEDKGISYCFEISKWKLRKSWSYDDEQGLKLQVNVSFEAQLGESGAPAVPLSAPELKALCENAVGEALVAAWEKSLVLDQDFLLLGDDLGKRLPRLGATLNNGSTLLRSGLEPQIVIVSKFKGEEKQAGRYDGY